MRSTCRADKTHCECGSLKGMEADQRIIAHDRTFVLFDEPDAAHVCCQGIDLVHAPRGDKRIIEPPQIQELKLMRGRDLVFRKFDIYTANPKATGHEVFREMVPDKAAGASHQNSVVFFVDHKSSYLCLYTRDSGTSPVDQATDHQTYLLSSPTGK